MTNEQATQKLKIQIGDAVFEADGPSEVVQEQLKAFVELLNRRPQPPEQSAQPDNSPKDNHLPPGDLPKDQGQVSEDAVKKVFRGEDGYISLSATPHDPADGLLLLLYGFDYLMHEPQVTGVTLMKAAKKSGIQIERIDRVISDRDQYILTGGAKRGKRYSLNNRGIAHVEAMIKTLIE